MDLISFGLTAEYEGTVDVVLEDGTTEERDKFQGGLLYVGDGDIDIAAELANGAGVINVMLTDQRAIDLLDAYPALKRVATPAGAQPYSPYHRRTLETLQHEASLRDIPGSGSRSKLALATALISHDVAQLEGDATAAAAITVAEPGDGLDRLTKAQLIELAGDTVDLDGAATNADMMRRLREAGVRAPEEA